MRAHHRLAGFTVGLRIGLAVAGVGMVAVGVAATAVSAATPTLAAEGAEAHLQRGVALAKDGDPAAAAAAFREALAIYPAYPLAANELAALLASDGDLEGAEPLLDEAVALDPDFAAAWANLGEVRRRGARHEGAVDAYLQSLRVDLEVPDTWYGVAASLHALGRHAELLAALRRFVELADDDDPRYAEVEAAIEALESRHVEARDLVIPKSAPTPPPAPPAVEVPGLARHEADAAYDRAHYLAAAEAYRRALVDSPGDPTLRYKLGATLAAMRDMHGASQAWAWLLARDPDRELVLRHVALASQVLAERGHLDVVAEDDEDDPLARARAALLAHDAASALVALSDVPEGTKSSYLTAEAELRLGLYQRARGRFEQLLSDDPEDRAALGGLAEALLRLGADESAGSPMSLWLAGSGTAAESFLIMRAEEARIRIAYGPPAEGGGDDDED